MTNLNSILKSRDITLTTKIHIVKAMVFPVVMYDCESWTIKKTKSQKIDVFELWYWRRFLRVPWTALSNQLIPKEINPEYSLENCCWSLSSKLGLPDAKSRLIGKDLDVGKGFREEEKGMIKNEMVRWHYWLNGHEFEQTQGDSGGQRSLACCIPWGYKESEMT